jgi:hypothetical protein
VRGRYPGFALYGAGRRRLHFSDFKRRTRSLPKHVLGLETGPIGSRTASRASYRRTNGCSVRETNPVPLKQALASLSLMTPAVRLPLVRLSEPHRIELSEVLFRLCHEHAEQMIGSTEAAPVNRRLAVGQ